MSISRAKLKGAIVAEFGRGLLRFVAAITTSILGNHAKIHEVELESQ